MFTLSATDDKQREADETQVRQRLVALVGVIPGLLAMSLVADLGLIEDHWDVVLISDHDDRDALESYQTHPAHLEVATFIRSVTSSRATVDYEA